MRPSEGLKVVIASGWLVARPSGTENVYKICAESFRDHFHLNALVIEAQEIVNNIAVMLAVGRKQAMPDQTRTMSFPPPLSRYRASGVLLHITSLPSQYGLGDMGPTAIGWIDRLHEAGQSYGDSPYQPIALG